MKCFSSLGEIDGEYEAVTLFHVVEHLIDPRNTLNTIIDCLGVGGHLFIETPNCDDALLSLYNSHDFANFTYWSCHLYLFNIKTLKLLLRSLNRTIRIEYIKQIQRYPLSNHLHWLARGKPGGHEKWGFINNDVLDAQYESVLASIGCCDTLLACLAIE